MRSWFFTTAAAAACSMLIAASPGRAQTDATPQPGNVMATEQATYIKAGMNECQMKPIDWKALHSAIDRHGSQSVAQGGPREQMTAPKQRPTCRRYL